MTYKPYFMKDVLDNSNKELFNVISTFAGGGGSSTGYRLAGGKILCVNEFVEAAVETYKSNYPEFGTNIDEQVIIPGVEDSLLIFDGKIRHQLCNMPFELAVHPQNHRYSIVFDFNIDKSTKPDNIAE